MEITPLDKQIYNALKRLFGASGNVPSVSTDETIARLSEKYGIPIVCESYRNGGISRDEPNERQKSRCAGILSSELALYPVNILERCKIRRIVLCSKLRCDGEVAMGCVTPDCLAANGLFIDGEYSSPFTYLEHLKTSEHVIHHELFHAIDYQLYFGLTDQDWPKLNDPSFEYIGNIRPIYIQGSPGYSDYKPGFASAYGMSHAHEDKAEVYARLIMSYSYMKSRVQKDLVLKRKVERIKELLLQFSPEFNDQFWLKIEQRCLQRPLTG